MGAILFQRYYGLYRRSVNVEKKELELSGDVIAALGHMPHAIH